LAKKLFTLEFQKELTVAFSEGSAPKSEIQLFKKGDFKHWSGAEFTVDDEFIDTVMENFESLIARSKDKKVVPIDYNHASLSESAEDARAAGWIVELKKKDDGLYAVVEWTSKAAEYIKSGEYRYISPEFAMDVTDEYGEDIEGAMLLAAAMTNRPFLKGMAPLELSHKRKPQGGTVELKEKIGKTLGLSGEFGDKEIVSALDSVLANADECRKALSLKAGDSVVEGIKAVIKQRDELIVENVKLSDSVKNSEGEVKKLKASEKVEGLILKGRLVPSQKDAFIRLCLSDEKAFEEIVGTLPEGDHLKTKGSGGEGNGGSEGDEDLNSFTLSIQKEKGLSYVEAYRLACSQRPDLAKKWAEKTRN